MPAKKKVSDDVVIETYKKTNSVHKTGELLGINHATVHERLVKLESNKKQNLFSESDKERLKSVYIIYRDAGKIDELAAEMGRTKQFICRQAGQLGLTDKSHKKPYISVWADMPEDVAKPILEKLIRSKLSVGAFCKKNNYGVVLFSKRMAELFPGEWDAITEIKRSGKLYKKGRAFEYRVKDFFSKNGYQVIRSAASKGPADLVAFKKGEILFIQCKIGNFHNIREWNLLVDIAESVGAKPIFATIDEQRKIAFWNMREKDGSRRSVLDSPYVITELRSQPAKTKSKTEFKGGDQNEI